MELCRGPDSEVAVLPVHHVEHPLHLVVIIVSLVQLQASILPSLQTEGLISLCQGLESLVSTLVGALDLHNAVLLLHQTVRDADQPSLAGRDKLLPLHYGQSQLLPQPGQGVSLVFLPVQSGRGIGDFNRGELESPNLPILPPGHSHVTFKILLATSLSLFPALTMLPNLLAGSLLFHLY